MDLVSELEEEAITRCLLVIRGHDKYYQVLSDVQVRLLAKYSTGLSLLRNQSVVKSGEPIDWLFILLSGTLIVLLDDQVMGHMTGGHIHGI